MSDQQKCFTGTLVAKRDVSVFADSPEEAAETIRLLYESGDARANVLQLLMKEVCVQCGLALADPDCCQKGEAS